MLNLSQIRTVLSDHYDLTPSQECADALQDTYARMSRVVSPPEWLTYAPYVRAINALKKERNAVITT